MLWKPGGSSTLAEASRDARVKADRLLVLPWELGDVASGELSLPWIPVEPCRGKSCNEQNSESGGELASSGHGPTCSRHSRSGEGHFNGLEQSSHADCTTARGEAVRSRPRRRAQGGKQKNQVVTSELAVFQGASGLKGRTWRFREIWGKSSDALGGTVDWRQQASSVSESESNKDGMNDLTKSSISSQLPSSSCWTTGWATQLANILLPTAQEHVSVNGRADAPAAKRSEAPWPWRLLMSRMRCCAGSGTSCAQDTAPGHSASRGSARHDFARNTRRGTQASDVAPVVGLEVHWSGGREYAAAGAVLARSRPTQCHRVTFLRNSRQSATGASLCGLPRSRKRSTGSGTGATSTTISNYGYIISPNVVRGQIRTFPTDRSGHETIYSATPVGRFWH